MRIGKTLLAAAIASSLVTTPVLANAQKLSVASAQRDAAPVGQEDAALGGGPIVITLLAIFAIVGGILVFVKDNEEDEPVSP